VFVIIVGCGRVGAALALRLYRKGNQVAVIDHLGASFSHLDPAYRGRTIEGEVLSEGVLRSAGAESADGLAAVTNSDPVNAVVGHVARSVFHVPSVVVRNYDPRFKPLHDAFRLTAIGSTAWGAERIEDLLCGPGDRAVHTAGGGEVEVRELLVPEAWREKPVADVLPEGCRAVSHTRDGRAALPWPATRLRPGDVLLVAATPDAMRALRAGLAREAGRS
jgi:trk system potassium uptake protein TrkA